MWIGHRPKFGRHVARHHAMVCRVSPECSQRSSNLVEWTPNLVAATPQFVDIMPMLAAVQRNWVEGFQNWPISGHAWVEPRTRLGYIPANICRILLAPRWCVDEDRPCCRSFSNWSEIGSVLGWSTSAQFWHNAAQSWSMSAELGPSLTALGPARPQQVRIGQLGAASARGLGRQGRSFAELGRSWPTSVQTWSNSGRLWPTPVQICARSAQTWSKSVQIGLCPGGSTMESL